MELVSNRIVSLSAGSALMSVACADANWVVRKRKTRTAPNP